MAKRGMWRPQSGDQSVLNVLVRFKSTFFVLNWQVFVVFLNNFLHSIVGLVTIIPFLKQKQTKTEPEV